MPTESGRACAIEIQKASMVWPERVRPLRSTTVTEIITGGRIPVSSPTSSIAISAALALSVSVIVSTSSRSAPPSIRPRTCSAYASRISSKVTSRWAGSVTLGEIDSVRLVGPIAPATKRGRSGVRSVQASAARRASAAASRFISRTTSCRR
jgi:hypothetical protein